MLTTELLERSLSSRSLACSFSSHLVHAIQPATLVQFQGARVARRPKTVTHRERLRNNSSPGAERQHEDEHEAPTSPPSEPASVAHAAGTNALVVDKFEGRYLVTGGADGSISMWDLDAAVSLPPATPAIDHGSAVVHKPLGNAARPSSQTTFGITSLSYYPFDSLAFLASSYDHHLRIYSSETLQASASFSLSSVIYSHALSPVASHLLVACATQHPAVRLVDLRSGAATHSLAGHGGAAVFDVAWSPRSENVLASTGADGAVRVWDVRRSAASLGVLDMDDSIGIAGYDGLGRGARRRERGRAHAGPANGVVWTEDGKHLVTTGHDERIRVWDMRTGANTLANFGPMVRNRNLSALTPCLVPKSVVAPLGDVLFFPNEREILMYELFEGRLLKRLRVPGTKLTNERANRGNQIAALAWRPHSFELLSAHGDGFVRSWQPRTSLDALVEENEKSAATAELSETRKRKREMLEDIYRDLTQPKVTFT